jgi:hypothetical protein
MKMARRSDVDAGPTQEAYGIVDRVIHQGLSDRSIEQARTSLQSLRQHARSRQDRRVIEGALNKLLLAETVREQVPTAELASSPTRQVLKIRRNRVRANR